MKMPEILCKISGISTFEIGHLEVELHRKLNDPGIKRVSDLSEGGAGDRLVFSREEVRVVQNIEELRTKFDVGAFGNPGSLNHAEIEIPEARPAYRRQMQSTRGARQGMTKERSIGTPVGTNQPWIDDERTAGNWVEENTHAVLQLLDTQRGSRSVLT